MISGVLGDPSPKSPWRSGQITARVTGQAVPAVSGSTRSTRLNSPPEPLVKRDNRLVAEHLGRSGRRLASESRTSPGAGGLQLGFELRPEDRVQGSDDVEESDPLSRLRH